MINEYEDEIKKVMKRTKKIWKKKIIYIMN